MISATQRLGSLKVSDVMARDVVQVPVCQPMSGAAATFAEHAISAAPVIDDQGRCVGILSATDFLRRDCPQKDGRWEEHRLVRMENSMQLVSNRADVASSYMTSAVQSIAADATVMTAAMVMCAEHVHRLPVLDKDGRVAGVISTMDIVASLLNAVDEEATSFVHQIKTETSEVHGNAHCRC
ncbi:MAG: CBS domain-containing protein [Planctomycetes bacterium]|nr:CBS domain-containing protein [Planctomycetota bacterium]